MTDQFVWRDGADGARVLYGTLNPGARDAARICGLIEQVASIVSESLPDGFFLRTVRISCSTVRNGKPSGMRHHFVAVFTPLRSQGALATTNETSDESETRGNRA